MKKKTAYLTNIETPADLKKLNSEQLDGVSAEIRDVIVNTVSKTGGHLASSLGAVELTVALHYLFDCPRDKIVWDVGHQAYAHKILTARRERFSTLRKLGGISGFPKRSESEYDVFGAGHSSTSISAALGIAEGLSINSQDNYSIAVIGDGAMTGGMAFEALNNAGSLKSNMIVVLNDNEMSISPNVGALAHYLTRLITGHRFNKVKEELEQWVGSIPALGPSMYKGMEKLEDAFKSLFVPGMMFEELGFKYLGPIDGHNMEDLLETFEAVKEFKRPILVHVVTKKGKGFKPAEKNPSFYHGTPPFDVVSGATEKKKEISYTSVFGKAMVELAERDESVVAVTAAMREGTGLLEFSRRFPKRFYDVGIAEGHAVTFAAGLAVEGIKPVVAIYSTFLQRAFDQIFHDVCLQNLPVVFAIDRAGIVGSDGPTHHGMFDLSYLRILPNMVVMAPKDENELHHMLNLAVSCGKPAAIRYPRGKGAGVPVEYDATPIELGKWELLKDGNDIAILAVGNMLYPALTAAYKLMELGIDAAVVNARFLKPMDEELLHRIGGKTGRVLTVEEGQLAGGFGSAVMEKFGDFKVRCLAIPDVFVEQGSQEYLRTKYRINELGIVDEVTAWMKLGTPESKGEVAFI